MLEALTLEVRMGESWCVGLTQRLITRVMSSQGDSGIHHIYDLLEHVKGPVLQIQSCRASRTQCHNRLSRRGPSESPVSIVWQKPKA